VCAGRFVEHLPRPSVAIAGGECTGEHQANCNEAVAPAGAKAPAYIVGAKAPTHTNARRLMKNACLECPMPNAQCPMLKIVLNLGIEHSARLRAERFGEVTP
jgi:hypothetical protein